MIVRGVYVPLDLCPAIARLARDGARAAMERDGGVGVRREVAEVLDELNSAARAYSMFVTEHLNRTSANIGADSETRFGQPKDLTGPDAAHLLGLSAQHVGRLVRSGELRGSKNGNRWHIERESVNEYIAARAR